MDAAFARVLRALDDAGLADDTLVLCFTDHGLQFPRNMCNLTDQGIGVFLVARGPGGFRGGRVVDALVSLIDLAPTAYAAAGIDIPEFVQAGRCSHWCAARSTRCTRRSTRRSPTTRRTNRRAACARRATSTSAATTTTSGPC